MGVTFPPALTICDYLMTSFVHNDEIHAICMPTTVFVIVSLTYAGIGFLMLHQNFSYQMKQNQ